MLILPAPPPPQVTEKAGGEVNVAQPQQGMMGRVAAFSKRVGSALNRIGPQQPVLPVKVDAVKDKKKEEAKAKEKMVQNDKVVLLFAFQVSSASMAAWPGGVACRR